MLIFFCFSLTCFLACIVVGRAIWNMVFFYKHDNSLGISLKWLFIRKYILSTAMSLCRFSKTIDVILLQLVLQTKEALHEYSETKPVLCGKSSK